jgi:hypothetical protein
LIRRSYRHRFGSCRHEKSSSLRNLTIEARVSTSACQLKARRLLVIRISFFIVRKSLNE